MSQSLRHFFRLYRAIVLLSVPLLGGICHPGWAQTGQGQVADSTELRVLRQFYYSMQGDNWGNRTGWPTTPAAWQAATLASAAGWAGVNVSNGDVIRLDFTYNCRGGQLPAQLGDLRALQHVIVDRCQLTGQLPASLGQCANLMVLNAQYNQLSGPLPAALGNARALHHLYLDRNQLEGPIPASYAQLTQMQVLYLSVNKLTGDFPSWIGQYTLLEELGLDGNQLTGSLPADMANLWRLKYLFLFTNQIGGNLPPGFGQLTNLQYCYLSVNQFTGSLPAHLNQLSNLQGFYVDRNRLQGEVPPEVGQLYQLQDMALAQNDFTGPVPRGLPQMPLVWLYLHQNHFSDLPSWVGAAHVPVDFFVHANQLDFGALERNFTGPNQPPPNSYFYYLPQAPPPGTDTVEYTVGDTLSLVRSLRGKHTRYQWQRQASDSTWQNLAGQTDSVYRLPAAELAAEGLYRVQATNDWVTDLTLVSKPVYAIALTDCRAPRLRVTPTALHIEPGDAVTLKAVPLPATTPIQWRDAAGTVLGSGLTLVVTPSQTSTYTAVALALSPCTATTTVPVTITVVPPPPLTNPPTDNCSPTLAGGAPTPVDDTPRPMNYVRTFAARTALTDPAALSLGAAPQDVQTKTEYLDGLGRPVQTVLHQNSPLGHDVVQPVAYDALGRQPRQYLPYVASASSAQPVGSYRPNALYEQDQFYRTTATAGPGNLFDNVARTGVPYSEQVFEASPLSRVLEQAAPGEAWARGQGHTVGRDERPNTAADAVPRYAAAYGTTAAAAHALSYQGSYAAGELWAVQTRDEHGFRTLEFKDKQGQVVSKQVEQAAGQWLTTNYVYDDFQRLRAVLPPKATQLLATSSQQVTAAVDSLLFYYRYDGRGRVLAKQVPGQDGEVTLVYDQLDRPILTQDPQQRTRQEWSWTKYDALGRVVLTGLVTRNATAEQLQQQADQLGSAVSGQTPTLAQYEQPTTSGPHYYSTTGSYPRLDQDSFTGTQVLTVSYYDGYDFNQDGQADAQFDAQYNAQFTAGTAPQADGRVTDLPTRTKTRVLGVAENEPGAWLVATTFYDEKARPVQVVSTNARGGQDVVTTQLDFVGQVVQSYSVHMGPSNTTVPVKETFAYDHAGRLLEARQQLPGEVQPAVVARHAYNEVGQLVQKTLAPGTALQQQLDYTYNIRGWLTGLNEDFVRGAAGNGQDLWGMQLSYDCGFLVPQYNGNIAGQQWRSKSDGVVRAYGYLYDGANRLLSGDYVAQTPTGQWSAEQQHYGLLGMRYDANGNILGLQRRGLLTAATSKLPAGFGATDNLRYHYQGNRLVAVDDAVSGNALPQPAGAAGALTSLAGDFQEKSRYAQTGQLEYGYDANGNMTRDANKGLASIRYNHLNLPEQVSFSSQDYIEFRYAASGQKVAKRVHQAGKPVVQTDYLGAYQYEGDSLRFFPHAEGRVLRLVSPVSGQVRYEREYTLKDHLGNLRIAYRQGTRAKYWASLEPSRATTEEAQWDSVSIASTRFAAGSQARTPTAEGGYVARLNAAQGKPIGPLKMLRVQPGDTLAVLAPGYYPQPLSSGSTFSFSLLSFVTQLLSQQPPAPVGGEGGRKLRPLPFLGIGLAVIPSSQQTGRVPKGYLRVLVFNQDSVLLPEQTITRQLSELAGSGYEELRAQLVVRQAGYVQVYVGNESEVDVLFDDVQVDYRPGLLVQENHYDPWGLNLAGLEKTGGVPVNQYQYNGKEKQPELGLRWQDYGARMYDAQLGVFHTTDPLNDRIPESSVYAYAINNPIKFIDLFGLTPVYRNGAYYEDNEEVSWQYVRSWLHTSNAISASYRPLTKARLEQIAGPTTVSDGKRQADIGNRFEAVALESLGLSKYKGPPIESPARAFKTRGEKLFIQPDVVEDVTVHNSTHGFWSLLFGENYEGAYTDVKATNKGSIPMGYDQYQLYGFIHNLATSPAAMNGKRATLTLVSLAGSYPGPSLIREAQNNHVSLFMIWALERIENGHGTGVINFTSAFQMTVGAPRIAIPIVPNFFNKDVKF